MLAYFANEPARAYQLLQWLEVLEVLDATEPVALVLCDPDTAALVRSRTRLPVLLAETFPALVDLYAGLDAAVVLYVNNSPDNFASLADPRMLHVHVNHGESDKASMASNNAKAYDRVFVAGDAAVRRYTARLMELDTTRLVRVGRPQLDLRRPPLLPATTRRTLLYAPTWEGDADYNDYTSLVRLGERIVAALLAVPDARVVYKPHPRVVSSLLPDVAGAHTAVLGLLAEAARRDPAAGHVDVLGGDILALMPQCDLIVTDVSSVGLDWLYLRTDAPLVLADPRGDLAALHASVPISRCADVVDASDVDALAALVVDRLAHDPHLDARAEVRRDHFGDLGVGGSTARFLAEVSALVRQRDAWLAGR